MDINEAFRITKPLSKEKQKSLDDEMLRLGTEMRDYNNSLRTHFIQDSERDQLCIQCGARTNDGNCPTCGRVVKEMR